MTITTCGIPPANCAQWIQFQLWERHRLRTLRRTLKQLSESGQVDEQDGMLTLQEGSESVKVLVVYFRAGYAPTDYPSEAEWAARAMVENSNAAKCPTVAYQLAGCKKVQQDLARPGMLERFMEGPSGSGQAGASAEDCAAMRTSFAGLWSLDDLRDPSTAAIVSEAIAHPEAFVLKPQREGGGNNLYGPELHSTLSSAMAVLNSTHESTQSPSDPNSSEAPSTQSPASDDGAIQHGSSPAGQEAAGALSAYILMQRILPPPQRSVLARSGTWQRISTLSELGIYGVFCRVGNGVILNKEVGHLVRTKTATSNEGGVAAGFAVIDSPYLID
ncbi:homoglutathione synthetase GSHS2 [Dunaliella salina]|uniref:glutathione synthase n=1 Tax=Dunaliella salina TaxID=3046 RepID=A0ABQ7GWL0_DUNSA|nr:homoglutathione synthetase GSHS2 [Dunaliella salina]|eukprot:KAF5838970.1 homoglutathione synthetase GSHS2 [Dunaliella salina]